MATTNARRYACGTYAPMAVLATVGPAHQIGLCLACIDFPARRRDFTTHFLDARRRVVPVLAANRYLLELGASA